MTDAHPTVHELQRDRGEPVIKGATLSPCGTYRYHLYRTWDPELPHMVWLMLNPSTADASVDDMTIRKCMGFARSEGMGGIEVLNLFAYRATHPTDLVDAAQAGVDPEGPGNVEMWGVVLDVADKTPGTLVVAGWGASKPKGIISRALLHHDLRPDWFCYGRTMGRAPRHPSRLPYDSKLVRFR
jgi:hypothetical protein